MKTLKLVLAFAAFALLAPTSHAQNFAITLNGASEAPPNASLGTGVGFVSFNVPAHTMTIFVSFTGLTGPVTAAHIHAATAAAGTGTAGVATQTPSFTGFPASASGTYTNTFNMSLASSFRAAFITANGGTPASAELALVAAATAGKAYLNLHTATFPGGEIRGFLTPTAAPEPTTAALALLGLGALAYRRKRA